MSTTSHIYRSLTIVIEIRVTIDNTFDNAVIVILRVVTTIHTTRQKTNWVANLNQVFSTKTMDIFLTFTNQCMQENKRISK